MGKLKNYVGTLQKPLSPGQKDLGSSLLQKHAHIKIRYISELYTQSYRSLCWFALYM